ncbi:MAG: hypothetical protein ACYS9V_12665 [Planctomycetota bacterium]|jgi:hypothetical protein
MKKVFLDMNLRRVRKIINQSISNFDLNLSGLTILTEAATGYYILTPIIAALAQADYVLALTRDSKYGQAADIRKDTMKLAHNWDVHDKIQVIYDREDKRIGNADIITNLGFVRPIDSDFLSRLKKSAVIPLMWETWEYRSEDIDIEECRRLQIPVLGTNEHHPDLRIFEYIGHIALKLLFEAEIEILNSRIALLGKGEFADHVKNTLKAAHADVHPIFQENGKNSNIEKANNILKQTDALIVVEHHERKQLIGAEGFITPKEISQLNKYITIIHICGNVDQDSLIRNGVRCWPRNFAPAGHMSVTTDYIGPAPLIKLHTAGLKVGESLARARLKGLNGLEAELAMMRETSLAQGFPGYHDRFF